MEWVQIEFQTTVRGIARVEVAKRARLNWRFSKVEVRIGNVDESGKGAVQLSDNPLVGFLDEAVDEFMAVFDIDNGCGRYLTIQRLIGELELAEVFIFLR